MSNDQLKDVSVLITKGTTPMTIGSDFVSHGVNFIKAESLSFSKHINQSVFEHIDEATNEKMKRSRLEKDDLLFSIAGYLGKMGIVRESDLPANTNQAVAIIRLNKKKVDVDYIYYYLSQSHIQNYINRLSSQSVQPNLNLDLLGKLKFENREIKDQQKIAAVLSALDAKIELNQRINAELESMAKTLYDYWFVQFEFPAPDPHPSSPKYDGTSVIFGGGAEGGGGYKSAGGKMVWNEELKRNVPAGWEAKKVREFAETSSGGTPLSTKQEYYDNGTIPWINSGELNNPFIVRGSSFITEAGLNNSSAKTFPANTVLVALYGATAGKVSLLRIEACSNQAVCALLPKSPIYTNFLKYGFGNLYDYLVALSSGSARDNLSQEIIRNITFAMPPDNHLLEEFNKIVNPSLEKIVVNLLESQTLTELRDWLLSMLMNGQVKVG